MSYVGFSFFGNIQFKNLNHLVPEPFARLCNSNIKPKVQRSRHNVVVIKSHLVPRPLEGLPTFQKELKAPVQKLEHIRTLLIDNYDSYTYNIFQELTVVNGFPPLVVRNDEWTWRDFYHYIYEENAFDNIVISPGPGSPTSPSDIGLCLRVLHECSDIPILGICLGHQALGYVHGARVVHASEPVHGRLSDVAHNGSQLFHEIPSGRNSGFKVVRYHSLIIDRGSLPKELIPIAWTPTFETTSFLVSSQSYPFPNACEEVNGKKVYIGPLSKDLRDGNSYFLCGVGEIQGSQILMGIKHASRPHYGVQFHPESIGTCFGRQLFKNFAEITKEFWLRRTTPISVPNADQLLEDVSRRDYMANKLGEKKYICTHNIISSSNPGYNVKYLKMKWKKLDHLASQIGGSKNIFCQLFGAQNTGNTFWLDSSATEKGRARFSFMGQNGGSLWKHVSFRLSNERDEAYKRGGYLTVQDASGNVQTSYLEDGFMDYLNKELGSFCYDEKDYEGLPFDFYGGYVGYIGYDLKAECGRTINRHKSRTPDACFFFSDNLVVIDHLHDNVYIVSLRDRYTKASSWLDDIEQRLLQLKPSDSKPSTPNASRTTEIYPVNTLFRADKSREQYIKDIEKCQGFIRDGESYELCLTTQMRMRIGKMDPLGLYVSLREKNPAPYGAWLNFSSDNLIICSASPERFMRLDRNAVLEAKPIKGTIARGSTPEEDELLKLRLKYSEKDQAENLMIVDLLRNDLGRVCEAGTVHVPHLMEIESYATVHTMVSTIRGKKHSDVTPIDCVKAAFPGGSMTGAPKLRSMEILDSLESCSRGIYSGCIGFFSYNQTFDLNIVIRTVVLHDGEASIGAGGAITALSDPEAEYEEMVLKTRAPREAVVGSGCIKDAWQQGG
ncbi:unnamed protein product [Cuscuta campestris]|uniref:aminodeoxychorismate synthase n=1 Tax=Cuscuta campestris TaxID=132261 RepID=A0A484LQN9_9ASTE|nr:unnamed protein product [Cuscuta campestris]